jgi:hypothetical protein
MAEFCENEDELPGSIPKREFFLDEMNDDHLKGYAIQLVLTPRMT